MAHQEWIKDTAQWSVDSIGNREALLARGMLALDGM